MWPLANPTLDMDLASTSIDQPQTRGRGVHLDAELVHYRRRERVLQVDFRPRLDVQLRLTSWDDGLRLFRFEDGAWREDPADPQLFFFGPAQRLDPSHPVAKLCRSIPERALAIASEFSSWHVTVLRLLRESQAAADLACSSPNLLWLVAAAVDRRGLGASDACDLLRQRRVDLLSWCLGSAVRPAALRLVDKYEPIHRHRGELELLELAAAAPKVVSDLRHVPVVYPADLDRLIRYIVLRRCGCFRELLLEARARPDILADARDMVTDIRRLGQNLNRTDVDALLARCPTFARLRLLHDRWARRFNRRRDRTNEATRRERLIERYGSLCFPEPPLPGNATIVPIRTLLELDEEGTLMDHCVASYAEAVLKGKSYVYRVLAHERDTLEIRCSRRRPLLGQLRRRNNAAPSKATQETVAKWFGEAVGIKRVGASNPFPSTSR